MPIFQYKAKSKTAETVFGQIFADNRSTAIEKVHELGLLPVEVEVQGGVQHQQRFIAKKVKATDLYFFSRQLVTLLKSGVSILKALDIIATQIRDWYFKEIVQNINSSIKEGQSFSDALAQYPQVFSNLYIAMARAGEESGNLKETIAEMATYQQRQAAFNSKVRTALAYPMLMLFFGLGTVIFILTFVMPKITSLFTNFEQALPVATVFVMNASSFFLQNWLWLALTAMIFLFIGQQIDKSPAGRAFKGQLKLNTPFLGNFLLKVELARFARALELLLKSGLPILRSLHMATPMIDNEVVRKELEKCQEDLAAGKSLGESIKKIKFFPPLLGHLVAVGEESGSLAPTLHEVSEAFEQETEETIKLTTTYLEPLMIIAVGGVIGLIVIAMLMPIFQLDVFANG